MKNISSAIAAGLLVFGTATVAAAQAPAPTQAPQAQAHRAHNGKFGKHAGPGRRAGGALFRGIQLTDAEKANIKNVNAKYAPQLKALREQSKGQGKITRGDTAAMRQRWEANAPQREAMKKIMDAERLDLRGALSPANQAKFDANAKEMRERFAKRAEKGKSRRSGSKQGA
jgi:Spy/CpxP family protein refolding chaperone